jgi:hypothetical protein
MLTQRGRFCVTSLGGSTSPRISITIGSFSNQGQASCVHPTHGEWQGQSYDSPRHHSIALMCDDIEATVADLRGKGAQFRGPIEQREYGRVIMMAMPGADDIQLY